VNGATGYQLYVSCATGYEVLDSTFRSIRVSTEACPFHQHASIVAIAVGGSQPNVSSSVPIAYSALSDVDLAALVGMSVDLPAMSPVGTLTATVSNLPAEVTSLNTWNPRNRLASDPLAYAYLDVTSVAVANSALNLSIPVVPFGARTTHGLSLPAPSGLIGYSAAVAEQHSANLVVDASRMVRRALGVEYTAATRTFAWSESPGSDPNVVLGCIDWTTPAGAHVTYTFFTPRSSSTSLTVPALPAAIDVGQAVEPTEMINFRTFYFLDASYEGALESALNFAVSGFSAGSVARWSHP
jgi:hypothetical protein